MIRKYDVTLKSLLEDAPADWPALAGVPNADVSVIDADASEPYRIFRYQVIRVWELPVENLLRGGLACLALAPISAVSEAELPDVLRAIKQRLAPFADRGRIGRLWTAVYVLMGMRYERQLVDQLLQGVLGMKESVTYQAIVAEGRAEGRAEGHAEGRAEGALEEARKLVLRLGEDHFQAAAPPSVRSRLEESHDLGQMEEMARSVLRCRSWEELFRETRKPRRRKPRR